MTDSRPATAAIAQYDAEHMRVIEAGLTACGLVTHLTDSRAGLDLTARLCVCAVRNARIERTNHRADTQRVHRRDPGSHCALFGVNPS
jgi:hypothetical protein